MTQYVALLRGINVGGNNVIKMEALRAEFEKMGFTSVKTYIQSGNVVFESDMNNAIKIEKYIENALSKAFAYEARVLVRSKKDMENTIAAFPKFFEYPDWKHNVIFLSAELDSKDILTKFTLKEGIEQLAYTPGTLFWSAKMENLTQSSMLKLSARKEYKGMTVRNVNTTRKILAIMED